MSDAGHPPPPDLPTSWADGEKGAAGKPNRKRLLTIAMAIMATATVVVLGLIVINPFEKLTPKDRAWPEAISGRPDGLGGERDAVDQIVVTAGPGVYIWSGFDGWHLWVVNGLADDGSTLKGITGTITTTDDRLTAQLSAPIGGSVSTKGSVTTFELPGDVAVAGVDFEPGLYSKQLKITLKGKGGSLNKMVVTLGPKSKAKAVPVIIERAVIEKD